MPPDSQVKSSKKRLVNSTLRDINTYPGKYHGYDPITFIEREAVIHSRREDKEVSRLDCKADPSVGGDFCKKKKAIPELDNNKKHGGRATLPLTSK